MSTQYKHRTSYGVESRASKRGYLYVVVGKQPQGVDRFDNLDVVLQWSGTLESATKSVKIFEKRGFRNVRVERINNGE